MHIDSPEIFRLWLASELAPLSDANPESLAKYVHALAKKDKPVDELKDLMIDQLDVFLLGETKTFVQLIFKNLESKEYLSFKKEPEKDEKKEELELSVETEAIEPALTQEPDLADAATEKKLDSQNQSGVISEEVTKDDVKKDDKRKAEERLRGNWPRLKRDARTRSRSRSWERARRSRSRERIDRERDRERDRRVPAYRNKSPPRRYERRRSYGSRSPSPGGRYRAGSRSRSRSPKFPGRNRYRNRSVGRSRSRSRSRESLQRTLALKEDGTTGNAGTNRRCRDFDVKGFCMRGEFCPYDHGTDPVVVPPTVPFGVSGNRIVSVGPPMVVPPPGIVPPTGPPPHLPLPSMMMRPPPNIEYSPDAPALTPGMSWNRMPFNGPRHPYHPHQRELINVPVDAHGQPQDGRFPERKGGNCCLDIKKIPVGLNNIAHLNNHFVRFGKIVNIQVNYKNDPEAAMITFSSPAEAHAAFKSSEAVLNNRFIKVFWHHDKDSRNGNMKERFGPANNNRKQTNNENIAANQAMSLVKKPEKSTEEQKAQALAQLKKLQDIVEKNQLIRKKTEDNRKEVIELSTELRKRSQNLLEKHIQEQKELLKKLESGGLDEKQRIAVKDAIKALQETIEKVKSELLIAAKKTTPVKRTKEEIQKEILDSELDIISTQQEGGNLVPLYKKLAALKVELQKIAPVRPPRPSVPANALLLKHNAYSSHNLRKNNTINKSAVDHRPTKILVSGYESDEKDLVLAHFREFGEIADYILDDSTPSIVLNFKTRNQAEVAMSHGKNFQDRLLTVTWFTIRQPPRRSSAVGGGKSYHMHAGRQVLLSSDNDDDIGCKSPQYSDLERTIESGEEFLLPDDDDDGDDEERSWRR